MRFFHVHSFLSLLFVAIAGSFYDRVGDEYNTRKGNKSAQLLMGS
nr:MAG TPA: hypothetical protein [Caudoviricetes sp.]DAX74105.1 MAG TPA: hypothetical protein [Caudoviricetes sp.]